MMPLLVLCIISIMLMLLLQGVDLEVIRTERLRVYLGLTFFKYKIPTAGTGGGFKDGLRLFRLRTPISHALGFLLPRCSVTVSENLLPTDAPGELSSFIFLPFYFTLYSTLAYVKARAKAFELADRDEKDGSSLHITVKFRLFILIISALIFLYYLIVTRLKERAKNG